MLRQAGDAVQVWLRDGIYRLRAPFHLTRADSGQPGDPVVWQAAPGAHPVWSGSRLVRGRREDGLWVFPWHGGEPPGSIVVAGRQREPDRSAACPGCRVDAQGLTAIPAAIRDRLRVGSMVLIHARWRDFHCPVAALEADRVTIAQPCWHNTTLDSANDWRVASPVGKYYTGVDGFEQLSGMPALPGHFTVDASHHRLRYRPASDDPANAAPSIELPVVERLLSLDGSPADPVHDLVFRGITFAASAWRGPQGAEGYVSLQAGYLVTGTAREALPDNGEGMTRIAAAVTVAGGRDIVFDRDGFEHLAAAGLVLAGGTHGAAVTRSRFTDLGGGAIFAGDIQAHPAEPARKSSDLRIADNRIDHVARRYRDNVAIMAGFVDRIDIVYNTLDALPYSGISVGWGWNGEGAQAVQSGIHVVGNRVDRVMRQLADGGAIYTQGQSLPGGSCVRRNAIDMHHSGEGNGIYLDERSQYFAVDHNVVLGSWISAWADWSGHLRIVDNWTDTAGAPHNPGPTKTWSPNATGLSVLPAAARAVQRQAGARWPAPAPVLPVRVDASCPHG